MHNCPMLPNDWAVFFDKHTILSSNEKKKNVNLSFKFLLLFILLLCILEQFPKNNCAYNRMYYFSYRGLSIPAHADICRVIMRSKSPPFSTRLDEGRNKNQCLLRIFTKVLYVTIRWIFKFNSMVFITVHGFYAGCIYVSFMFEY